MAKFSDFITELNSYIESAYSGSVPKKFRVLQNYDSADLNKVIDKEPNPDSDILGLKDFVLGVERANLLANKTEVDYFQSEKREIEYLKLRNEVKKDKYETFLKEPGGKS